MKVEKAKKGFEPICLVLESQDDVNKIFALLNHADLSVAVEIFENPLNSYESDSYNKYHDNLMAIRNMGSI